MPNGGLMAEIPLTLFYDLRPRATGEGKKHQINLLSRDMPGL